MFFCLLGKHLGLKKLLGLLYCGRWDCILYIDATKAFDRVNYCKLFRQLLNREIHVAPGYLRLLLNS